MVLIRSSHVSRTLLTPPLHHPHTTLTRSSCVPQRPCFRYLVALGDMWRPWERSLHAWYEYGILILKQKISLHITSWYSIKLEQLFSWDWAGSRCSQGSALSPRGSVCMPVLSYPLCCVSGGVGWVVVSSRGDNIFNPPPNNATAYFELPA